jgi:hypothetical protein
MTMANIRLELAKEELEEAKMGAELAHNISPNIFLQVGLELEEQQYVITITIFFSGLTGFSQVTSSATNTH